jgi:hypothetical protein
MPAAVVGDVGLGDPLLQASGMAISAATHKARVSFRCIEYLFSNVTKGGVRLASCVQTLGFYRI